MGRHVEHMTYSEKLGEAISEFIEKVVGEKSLKEIDDIITACSYGSCSDTMRDYDHTAFELTELGLRIDAAARALGPNGRIFFATVYYADEQLAEQSRLAHEISEMKQELDKRLTPDSNESKFAKRLLPELYQEPSEIRKIFITVGVDEQDAIRRIQLALSTREAVKVPSVTLSRSAKAEQSINSWIASQFLRFPWVGTDEELVEAKIDGIRSSLCDCSDLHCSNTTRDYDWSGIELIDFGVQLAESWQRQKIVLVDNLNEDSVSIFYANISWAPVEALPPECSNETKLLQYLSSATSLFDQLTDPKVGVDWGKVVRLSAADEDNRHFRRDTIEGIYFLVAKSEQDAVDDFLSRLDETIQDR